MMRYCCLYLIANYTNVGMCFLTALHCFFHLWLMPIYLSEHCTQGWSVLYHLPLILLRRLQRPMSEFGYREPCLFLVQPNPWWAYHQWAGPNKRRRQCSERSFSLLPHGKRKLFFTPHPLRTCEGISPLFEKIVHEGLTRDFLLEWPLEPNYIWTFCFVPDVYQKDLCVRLHVHLDVIYRGPGKMQNAAKSRQDFAAILPHFAFFPQWAVKMFLSWLWFFHDQEREVEGGWTSPNRCSS